MVFVKTLTRKAPCFPSCYGTEVRPPVGSSVCFPQFPNSQLGFKEFPGRCSVAILSVIGAYCMPILLRTLIFLNSKIVSVNCLDYAFMLISLRSGVTSIAIRSRYSLCPKSCTSQEYTFMLFLWLSCRRIYCECDILGTPRRYYSKQTFR